MCCTTSAHTLLNSTNDNRMSCKVVALRVKVYLGADLSFQVNHLAKGRSAPLRAPSIWAEGPEWARSPVQTEIAPCEQPAEQGWLLWAPDWLLQCRTYLSMREDNMCDRGLLLM